MGSSLSVQASGAGAAAAILAERFGLPESTGIGVLTSLPNTLSYLVPLATALAPQKRDSSSACVLLRLHAPVLLTP